VKHPSRSLVCTLIHGWLIRLSAFKTAESDRHTHESRYKLSSCLDVSLHAQSSRRADFRAILSSFTSEALMVPRSCLDPLRLITATPSRPVPAKVPAGCGHVWRKILSIPSGNRVRQRPHRHLLVMFGCIGLRLDFSNLLIKPICFHTLIIQLIIKLPHFLDETQRFPVE